MSRQSVYRWTETLPDGSQLTHTTPAWGAWLADSEFALVPVHRQGQAVRQITHQISQHTDEIHTEVRNASA